MSATNSVISQKEYLKRYLSGDAVKKKKKKVSTAIKRSKIVDDDIDLKSMRPLDDDEVELYQMDEEGPQIAGIVDERPAEVKAQEYYNSKRWKVFGGDNGVSVLDNLDDGKSFNKLSKHSELESNILNKNKHSMKPGKTSNNLDSCREDSIISKNKRSRSSDSDISLPRKSNCKSKPLSSRQNKNDSNDSDNSFSNKKTHCSPKSDSDLSPSRKNEKRTKYDSDASPPRRQNNSKNRNYTDNDSSLSRRKSPQQSSRKVRKTAYKNDSDNSPSRKSKTKETNYKSDSDNSPPRKVKKSLSKDKFHHNNSYSRSNNNDKNQYAKKSSLTRDLNLHSSSDSDNSPPRKGKRKSPISQNRKFSRSNTPPVRSNKFQPHLPSKSNSRLSRKDMMNEINVKRHFSDSDDSPPRRKISQSPTRNKSSSKGEKPLKKSLYKPNNSSSSDENSRYKKKKMKTTLDGKQAGLQDAKELKKELHSLKMKEDLMFSKMDASVSGVGAAPVKRDRKTGQVRDIEKEKEIQKEKEAKASVVNEKYHKWGKGLKQVEDAAVRTAEIMKEMNKPLARYVDDKDLDNYLKAQEREGDPMLDYIKQKQSESTALTGAKPIYQGSFNPNRFGIRPGHRWDGVVRSSGYEKEWFTHQNARKARDEEAYKWSTSDM